MKSRRTEISYVKSALYMDTVVNLKVVTSRPSREVEESLSQAFSVFRRVEDACSRFNPQSELSRLSLQVGIAVPVSDLLFEAIRFAWEIAEFTHGAFDPTIGGKMLQYGFNHDYLSGYRSEPELPALPVTYRDIKFDPKRRLIKLEKKLVLDLGAIAKGLAIDLAARVLSPFQGFLIDAGGDIFAGGLNEHKEPWLVGIRHPMKKDGVITMLRLTNQALCTSGSYERRSPLNPKAHHLIEPLSGIPQSQVLSCTVLAPFAMMADAFATAAFILGQDEGKRHLEKAELNGLFVTPSLEMHMTPGMRRYLI